MLNTTLTEKGWCVPCPTSCSAASQKRYFSPQSSSQPCSSRAEQHRARSHPEPRWHGCLQTQGPASQQNSSACVIQPFAVPTRASPSQIFYQGEDLSRVLKCHQVLLDSTQGDYRTGKHEGNTFGEEKIQAHQDHIFWSLSCWGSVSKQLPCSCFISAAHGQGPEASHRDKEAAQESSSTQSSVIITS